jgi:hypothetical protein
MGGSRQLGLPASGGCLDQLDHTPVRGAEVKGVFGDLPRRGQRDLEARESVVKHRVGPPDHGDPNSLAPLQHIFVGRLGQRDSVGFAATQGVETQGAIRREADPGRFGRGLYLLDQRRCTNKIAGEQVHVDARAEGERKLAERAGLVGKLDVPTREEVPAVVIPQMQGGDARQPQPTQLLCGGHVAAESAQCPPQGRHPGRVTVAKQRCQAIKEKIGRPRRMRRRGGRTRGG